MLQFHQWIGKLGWPVGAWVEGQDGLGPVPHRVVRQQVDERVCQAVELEETLPSLLFSSFDFWLLGVDHLCPIHSYGVTQGGVGFPGGAQVGDHWPPAHHEHPGDYRKEAELVESNEVVVASDNLTQHEAVDEEEEEWGENENRHEGNDEPVLVHLPECALRCCVVDCIARPNWQRLTQTETPDDDNN